MRSDMVWDTKELPILVAVLFTAILSACGQHATASQTKFQVGAGGSACPVDAVGHRDPACVLGNVGHETLTKAAINLANRRLAKINLEGFWDTTGTLGQSGVDSPNALIRGNYATDKPQIIPDFDVREFQRAVFGVDPSEEWHTGGNRQVFHALRNYIQDVSTEQLLTMPITYSIDSGVESCERLKRLILMTSKEALASARSDHPKWPYAYIVGTATHSIQDSFSQAHTQRDKSGLLTDICKYGQSRIEHICWHSTLEAVIGDDRIFTPLPDHGFTQGLKPEAKLAIDTTAAYLIHMARILSLKKDADDELQDFFAGSPNLRRDASMADFPITGSFSCELLSGHQK